MNNISNFSSLKEKNKNKLLPKKIDLEEPGPILKISESYILGVDINDNGDLATISVLRMIGVGKMEIVNQIQGEEAQALYTKLTNKDPKGGQNNE